MGVISSENSPLIDLALINSNPMIKSTEIFDEERNKRIRERFCLLFQIEFWTVDSERFNLAVLHQRRR